VDRVAFVECAREIRHVPLLLRACPSCVVVVL
jgi:hypothetical protein